MNRKKAKASSAQTIGYVAAKGTTTLTSTNDEPFNARRFRTGLNGIPQPMGMRWDASSWSCAYDSLLTIMHLLYSTHNQMWTDNIADYNEHFKLITDIWSKHPLDPNIAKAEFQRIAHALNPTEFPLDGITGTSIISLCELLTKCRPQYAFRIHSCTSCGKKIRERRVSCMVFPGDPNSSGSIVSTPTIARHFID